MKNCDQKTSEKKQRFIGFFVSVCVRLSDLPIAVLFDMKI